ncbi:MAG: tetratricopeptide repeat protein, partial [Patescibacteria group bacterium]|nr:tetratricopeptide repeat protein [Patescibacteria group bacterium]
MLLRCVQRRLSPAGVLRACAIAGCLLAHLPQCLRADTVPSQPAPSQPSEPKPSEPEPSGSQPSPTEPTDSEPSITELQSPVEPFTPAEARSAAEQRRLDAFALFATGRSAEQREELESALRLYQRALRRDPHSAAIARAIVPLAFRLKRPAVAVRYALRAAELEEADPVLLQRLGVYLTEQGDWEQAVRLFERALAARPEPREGTDVLLHMELGRLHHLIERHEAAADHFAAVIEALASPKEFSLDAETTKVLLGDPAATYSLMADCFLLAGRFKEARAAYEQADKADPRPGRLQVNLARVL